ncbi:Cell cycle protein GpsB [bioreactor metagenome]|uniref:Cell cycle protein GpsB n=1 Tax=bioreactor metagenome TaxID=1076179 RepID=A0A644XMD8_9ZZZZ|nr:DivIVA domain-containing protein [Oscillibacter sp.]
MKPASPVDAEGVFALLTPQEVSGHAFTKAVMGGYNMAMVDEFLDELTDDYTALYKENAALKAKMKVLVEKVEDYRATEDSMRATLLTAQKMADSIVREAEAKRDQLLRDAEVQAQEKIGALRREAEEAQDRLRMGQREMASFAEKVRAVCQQEIQFLDQLPQAPVDAPAAPEPGVPAKEIETKILNSFRQEAPAAVAAFAPESGPVQTVEVQPGAVQPAPESSPRQEKQPSQPPAESEHSDEFPYPEGNPFVPMADEPTRKIELDELKFGRNYNRPNESR